ncbi:hypothetical protein A3A64_01015 [Candidatus Gottesmanbacteria bacterium RIFCSPLOWO2_01_FULL_48_11]|uniref:Extracellular solute-binding protein family 1 n=3 Tax=Candidatus Gottesmaniibacteriota TaxID=1752720 RepID=A0A0G1UPS5_9BACT|nr:MAG: Extracellular solute-binding protein family 1 [Candidatus Gottesmanbacteria bacterium GW2011_GWA2_47_9]KKU96227.1 MAG: Extracellular solute-binding protein family 1 [Candidatus Gottesmanbacteria bacterium GW2011_GWA1_48_13]OGG28518.1 MAG: hypothetical protein A3A64_01015 [Candidatus Gottesmanbacteria bacterium RIFCSPLOWO2_01_FULL_48_11]
MDEGNTNSVVPVMENVPPAPGPAEPAPGAPETLVIPVSPQPEAGPPLAEASPPSAENQFAPQIIPAQAPPAAAGTPPGSNPMPKRLLMIVVFIVLLLGLGLLGRFVYGLLAGAKEVTIIYWGLWENDALIRPVIADFESSHPKIKVQYVKQSHKQYRERLQAAVARGDGPDVFRFHNTWVAMLANDLSPVPKTVMTAAEFAQAFYPVAVADLVGGQSIYGIPLMIDGLGLYYNEDLLASAGVVPPTTWEEMLNIVPKLTVKTDATITTSAIALGTTGNVENFSDILALMMMQNGANLREPTSQEAEETLIFYRKFADAADPVYTWNETLDNSIYAFAMGKVAMILAPSWRAFDVRQINPNLRFKIAPVPQLPGNTVSWASYWVEGVSGKSKYQEQAWEFVKYLTGKEAATKLYTEASKTRLFGEPYARVELGSGLASDPYVGAFIKQAANSKSFPLASRTFDNGINDKLIKYMEDAVNGMIAGSSPKAVLTTAASGFRQVLGSYGLSSGAAPAR